MTWHNKKELHIKLLFVFASSYWKHNLANSLLVTVIAQFTARMTKWEKAVYFLSLMSCSISKFKSHMFFTCKTFMFRFYLGKNFAAENDEGAGAPPGPSFSCDPVSLLVCMTITHRNIKMTPRIISQVEFLSCQARMKFRR